MRRHRLGMRVHATNAIASYEMRCRMGSRSPSVVLDETVEDTGLDFWIPNAIVY